MKAKEYLEKHFADVNKDTVVKVLADKFDAALVEMFNECVQNCDGAKLLRTQVTKFKESNNKWIALCNLVAKRLEIRDDYQRTGPITSDATIDSGDMVVIELGFSTFVFRKFPEIHKHMTTLSVARDRMPTQNELYHTRLGRLREFFNSI